MALAILDLLAFDGAHVRFRIDTGTNKYYQLKAGKSVQRSSGTDWVDEVFLNTRMAVNDAGGSLFNSSREISIPATRLGAGHTYVQLFSFKTAEGKSPAFSRVLKVPVGVQTAHWTRKDPVPLAMSTSIETIEAFQPPRAVACRTCPEAYAQTASLEDLLAGLVKVAGPVVMNLLGGGHDGGAGASAGGGNNTAGQPDVLVNIFKTLLGSISGALPLNKPQSLLITDVPENRFGMAASTYAQPFIFGIDDAALAALAGPIIQVLPQLMNSANQKRVDLKKADNQLITNILSDVNRRLLMDQLLQAQKQPPAAGQPDNSAAINQVIQLLQQAGTQPGADSTATTNTNTAATSGAKSMSLSVADNSVVSSKAVLAFITAEPIAWSGGQKVLFVRDHDLQLKLQLKAAQPPKSALPKAIVKIILQDASDQSVRFEKVFKQKDVSANTPVPFSFAQGELSHLPANKPISVLAEMRWVTKSGTEYKALGSTEIVLVNKHFYKEQGGEVGIEQELTDTKRFRAFWNKVWESPSLDASTARNSEKKYLWELNANAKYTILLAADHDANGLMQTKLLRAKPDPESLSETIEGRMKAGIELSIAELNKLLPLWTGEAMLAREKLEALQTKDFARNNSGEFIQNLKLKGRAAERGIIWVIPVFKLFECTLGTVARTDDAGQVISMSEDKVHFPLPVSARVIGVKSQG